MPIEEFARRFTEANFARESLTMLKQKKDDPADQIYVFFAQGTDGPKVGIRPIKE